MKFGVIENIDAIDFSLPELDDNYLVINSPIAYHEVAFNFGAPVWGDTNYKGTLYPQKTSQKNFLREYSKQFNSIEFNATRYGIPKTHVVQNWINTVSDNFKFSMKIPQFVTHRKDMNESKARYKFDEFLSIIDMLGNHNGMTYGVMPNYLKYEHIDKLEIFVKNLPTDVPFAIELRHPSWFESEENIRNWYDLMRSENITVINTASFERRDVLQLKLSSNQLFVRYVGRVAHPQEKRRIKNWVQKIKALIDKGGISSVWFYCHQPGENHKVVQFFNEFIDELNQQLDLNLKRLVDYELIES